MAGRRNNDLPNPCPTCQAAGDYIVIEMTNGTTAATRCTCARGQRLALIDRQREQPAEEVADFEPSDESIDAASQAVQILGGLLGYFPADPNQQTLIADEIARMCRSGQEMLWLVRRVARLYSNWPGIKIMRMVYCARYHPADGVELRELPAQYPDGFPAERPVPEPAPRRQLPPGQTVSEDRRLDQVIQRTAIQKILPAPRTRADRARQEQQRLKLEPPPRKKQA